MQQPHCTRVPETRGDDGPAQLWGGGPEPLRGGSGGPAGGGSRAGGARYRGSGAGGVRAWRGQVAGPQRGEEAKVGSSPSAGSQAVQSAGLCEYCKLTWPHVEGKDSE